MLDNKEEGASTYAAMAKLYATDACFEIADDALQMHGGYPKKKKKKKKRKKKE
jgi:alkylation response protein AidB-like acyl-CoA dehydrogenase